MKEGFEEEKNNEIKENEEVENNVNSKEPKTKEMSKKKKTVIVLLGTLLIGLVMVFAFSSYKLLFTPKKLELLTYITKDVGTLNSFIDNAKNNKLLDFITNGVTKNIGYDFSLDSKNTSGEAIIDNEFFAVKLNEINDNYILLENKNLDKLVEKFGFEQSGVPSELSFENNQVKLNKREKKRLYNFFADCLTNIVEKLDNKNFIVNSEALLNMNGENVQLKSIEVQLSEMNLFDIQKEFLDSLEKKGMLDLIVNKINSFGTSEVVNKKDIEKSIEKYIAYLDYAKAYYALQEQGSEYYIVYRMYIDETSIVAREILEKYTYEGKLYEDIIFSLITNKNDYYEVKWFNQEDYNSAYYSIISDAITADGGNKQNHMVKYKLEGFCVGYSEDAYQYIPVNSETIFNFVFEELEDGTNKLELVNSNDTNNLVLTYNDKSANLDASTVYGENSIKLKLEVKDSQVTKRDLLNVGAIVVNEMPQEELMTEFAKIGSEFTEIFTELKVEE